MAVVPRGWQAYDCFHNASSSSTLCESRYAYTFSQSFGGAGGWASWHANTALNCVVVVIVGMRDGGDTNAMQNYLVMLFCKFGEVDEVLLVPGGDLCELKTIL